MPRFVFVALLFASLCAQAQTTADLDFIESTLRSCETAAQSNLDHQACVHSAYSAADHQLNLIYYSIVNSLEKSTQLRAEDIYHQLITGQHAWAAFRDANRQLRGMLALGGCDDSIVGGCVVMTINRARELLTIGRAISRGPSAN